MKINKEFFSYFKGFDLKEVAECVLSLEKSDQDIILAIWGENPTIKLNNSGKKIITNIKKKIGKKSLMDKLQCYDKVAIDKFLKMLSERDVDSILKEYYVNEPLPKEEITKEEVRFNESILSRVIFLNGVLMINQKNLYYAFRKYKEEEVRAVFDFLNVEEKNLIYKKFGYDFLNTDYVNFLSKEDNNTINHIIIPKMIKMIKQLRNKTAVIVGIEDLFPKISKQLILIRSTYLLPTDRERLLLVFGYDLSKKSFVTKSVMNCLLNERTKSVLENEKINQVKKINHIEKITDGVYTSKSKGIKRLLKMRKAKSLLNIYDENITVAIMAMLYLDEEINDEEFLCLTGYTKVEICDLIRNDVRIFNGTHYKKYERILKKYENK